MDPPPAVLRLGRVPELRLRPRPDVPELVARVVPGGPAPVSRTVRSLAAAIRSRRSNRWPFTDLAVPTVVRAELVAAAAAEGAVLVVTDRSAASRPRWRRRPPATYAKCEPRTVRG